MQFNFLSCSDFVPPSQSHQNQNNHSNTWKAKKKPYEKESPLNFLMELCGSRYNIFFTVNCENIKIPGNGIYLGKF